MEKYLVISVSGIGSTLLMIPALKQLKRARPQIRLDVLVGHPQSAQLLSKLDYIDNIYIIDRKITRCLIQNVKTLITLFLRRYDCSIMAFPANRAEFNVLAFLIHAKRRLSHKYLNYRFSSLLFLNNRFVKQEKVHDIIQNLNLLNLEGINIDKSNTDMSFELGKDELTYAKKFFRHNNLTKVVGVHVGSSPDQPYKRWSPESFAYIISKLNQKSIKVILFEGPSEKDTLKILIHHLDSYGLDLKKDYFVIKESNILNVAALIKHCSLFLTNDSGLMHLAVCMGTEVVAVYGASDPRRTAPYMNMNNVVTAGLSCQPCNRTLENLGEKFRCVNEDYYKQYNQYKCLDKLHPDKVWKVIKQRLGL